MASSGEQLGRYENCNGSRLSRNDVFDQPFKALHHNQGQGYLVMVVGAGKMDCLKHVGITNCIGAQCSIAYNFTHLKLHMES